MVKNLADAGFPVVAYNRTERKCQVGSATVTASLEDAVQTASVVFVMVSDGSAVRDVLFGENAATRFMERGTLIVNMSTIGVDETKQLGLELANLQLELMDAPVSGSVGAAVNKGLVVLAGGSESAFRKVEPLFTAMSKAAYHLGPQSSGAAMKLFVNAYLGMIVAAASECMAVADKAGLGREAFLKVLADTGMWAPILAGKQPLWVNDEFDPAFSLKHMTKDLGLMATYGTQLSAAMPNMLTTLSTYLQAQAGGLAEYDMAAVAQHTRQLVGADV